MTDMTVVENFSLVVFVSDINILRVFLAAHTNYNNAAPNPDNRLGQPIDNSYKSGEVSIPRPTYNHLEMEQPLGLRGNIANLSHIVDRYNNDERMLTTLQPAASQYYGDKGLNGPHMFNKQATSSIFNQAANMGMQSYNQQGTASSMYNRQMTELQTPPGMSNDGKSASGPQPPVEKKTKKRKSSSKAGVFCFFCVVYFVKLK